VTWEKEAGPPGQGAASLLSSSSPPLIFLIREAIDKAINQLIHFPSVCWARLIFFSLFQQGKSEGRKHASNIILTLTFLRLISLYITFLYITYLSLLYICFNLITLS
jgi:hypothetical protein